MRNTKHALHLARAVRYAWQGAPGWTLANGTLILVQGVLPLLLLYLMKLLVDSVSQGLSSLDKTAAFEHVVRNIILFGATILFGMLCGSLTRLVKDQQSEAVTDHMHKILHSKSIEVDLEYYENPEYYDEFHRAQREGTYRPSSIVNGLVQTFQNAVSLLLMALLLASFSWKITAFLFISIIPGIFVQLSYSGKLFRWQCKQTPTERKTTYFNWLLTGDTFAKELRLFGLGPHFIDRYRDLRRTLRREKRQISAKRTAADLLAQAAIVGVVLGSFAMIAQRAVRGSISLGDMVMYFGAFQRGLGNLAQILSGIASLYEDSLFLSSFYRFLELKPKVREPSNPRPFPHPIANGIVFDHVSFQYPTDGRPVLKSVDLSIRAGEVIALVGENGSGKTTLVKLLCRLYDPVGGSITIDGLDLREFGTRDLRREVSVVFQDYVRYSLTARENIWFGNVATSSRGDGIIAAAQTSGAHEVISQLSQGYETVLGKLFDDGEELSVGEWQKIALARAFLRDAQIIVLDEPTSSMDAKSEFEIFKKFRRLSTGRTAILISHRFSTVRMADRIFVLENGTVIESGTHSELVRSGGKYASLFETQAQYYR